MSFYLISLILSYEGTHFQGWQDNGRNRSVEGELKKALARIFGYSPKIEGASRTDAGVHAWGQLVTCELKKLTYPLEELQYRLNCILPKDLVITKCQLESTFFHPSIDCQEKTYLYQVSIGRFQSPFERSLAWHYPYNISQERLEQACQALKGKHDFICFACQKENHPYESYVRHLFNVEYVFKNEKSLHLRITGDRFFYKFVRRLVGSCLDYASSRLNVSIDDLIKSKNPLLAGQTAPAHGLYLEKVVINSSRALSSSCKH